MLSITSSQTVGLPSAGLGVEMRAGDYLYTEAGEEHDVIGVTDAVIFVSSQKATPAVE